MIPIRLRTPIVCAVAVGVGAVLAQVAGAGPEPNAAPATVVAPAVTSVAATASANAGEAPSGHDESDIDDAYPKGAPRPAASVAHALIPHVAVTSKDGMLRLPGGRFTMGSGDATAPPNEKPAHAVAVPAFWIDRTEVTVAAYRACVDRGACKPPTRASANCTYDMGDPDLPVSCVHWSDGDNFCRASGKRLPTEVEWEYAARGLVATRFPWGGAPSCQLAVTMLSDKSGRSCEAHPTRVGTHPNGASAFGVLDLSGNVEEWTSDWYVESLGRGPAPRTGASHVLRGGGWLSPPSMSRTTTRNWGSAMEAGPNVGFRCARSDEPAPQATP